MDNRHPAFFPPPFLRRSGCVNMTRPASLLIAFFIVWSLGLSTDGYGEDPTGIEYFETHVRPLLVKHCYECHGPETQERELRLDRTADLRKGGASGEVISPGRPQASLLITAVRYVDDELQMPPGGKLNEDQIAALVHWVQLGAPLPDEGAHAALTENEEPPTSEVVTEHWAFRTPVKPPLPRVNYRSWARSPIDLFVLARLESEGIAPAPPASPRELIRRASFDVTGLPPTPEEVHEFVRDTAPSSYARLIDRLLASPRYGERWGRHWLDVARYADSNGLDENVAYGNAWRYRDYVIGAMNRDKPYDQFVREQLAGDLLPTDDLQLRNERLTATGFLALGPKVLAEVDERKMEMDIVDEQIDTFGRSLIGLTLGCARCHDHKFDPIRTEDYYSLAGIFKSTRTMDSFTKIARWHENPLSSRDYEEARAIYERNLASAKSALAAWLATATASLQQSLGPDATLPKDIEKTLSQEQQAELQRRRQQIADLEEDAPVAPTAMGVADGEPTDVPVHIRGSHLTLGDPAPRGVLPMLPVGHMHAAVPADHSGRLELANWLTHPDHPLLAHVMVNRIWRWHFGRGLVETTDNFGRLGARPDYPELLDWLSVEFIESGWSIKHLHRLLMHSATYQMRSHTDGAVAQRDQENRWLGHANLRRLEAEELRDSLLFVAGELDMNMGGSLLTTANRSHIFDHTSKDDTVYASRRRSVYLPVVRNHLHDAFTLFDYTDASVPNGNRQVSTVPSQALYLMNSDFLAEIGKRLAEELYDPTAANVDLKIVRLYNIALGREPQMSEIQQAHTYLKRFDMELGTAATPTDRCEPSAEAWQLLCQALLMSHDFCYVR